jgi:hypothetical protein
MGGQSIHSKLNKINYMSNNDVLSELLRQRQDAQLKLYMLSADARHQQDAIAETIKSIDKAITSICVHSEYDKEYDGNFTSSHGMTFG